MKVLFQAIYGIFAPAGAKPALYTATNGLFDSEAPIGTQLPYCVYTMPVTTTKYWFDGRDEIVRIQIDLYAISGSAVDTLYENCKTLYDDCRLTVTGYTFGKMERISSQRPKEENCWRWIVDYDIWLYAAS